MGDGSFLPKITGATRAAHTGVKFPTTFPTIIQKDNKVKVGTLFVPQI